MVEGKHYFWVERTLGYADEGAVAAGVDVDGWELYVCRSRHEGDLVPGRLAPRDGCAYVPWGGGEHVKLEYEVLVVLGGEGRWVATRGGCVPIEALEAGAAGSEPLFVGRACFDGLLVPGKVHPSHGVCYISYGGAEIACPEYEVLVIHI
ncbi:uncharacterized protein LOC124613120 [Schistocerca americana]|uniref:uncharacterized protein LOC124613120 n=1 Tax=Schistocerca americana TaxID=7009 RepID=UPI001F4F609B|nr:uncharacterized protein LOC124613120 [Schistocerca americana]XP_047115748.1 uncharacterized protein LOC124795711 [Schistocerca piceifrons]XP_049961470.1 uncharacterized protein LOC126481624 [Schistocerca serialis cubense]